MHRTEETGTVNVMLVDDSPILRERLKAMLNEVPGAVCVAEATDGGTAMEILRSTKPDIVILDIRMPGRNGIEVLRDVKRQSPATIVMMLTNYPTHEHRKVCEAAGADYFFDKSRELAEVVQVLERLTRRRPETAL